MLPFCALPRVRCSIGLDRPLGRFLPRLGPLLLRGGLFQSRIGRLERLTRCLAEPRFDAVQRPEHSPGRRHEPEPEVPFSCPVALTLAMLLRMSRFTAPLGPTLPETEGGASLSCGM
jgi:hypothetical protein